MARTEWVTLVATKCGECGEMTPVQHDIDGLWIDCECGNFGYLN